MLSAAANVNVLQAAVQAAVLLQPDQRLFVKGSDLTDE